MHRHKFLRHAAAVLAAAALLAAVVLAGLAAALVCGVEVFGFNAVRASTESVGIFALVLLAIGK